MCGIAGSIRLNPTSRANPAILQGLIWANRERGTDALGLFDTSGRMLKASGDPSSLLKRRKWQKWLLNSTRNSWATAIHTRHKTRGDNTDKNAHPFRYDNILGSHNGMVQAPQSYEVDSEYLFDTIAKDGIYGIESIAGYWGLSWVDLSANLFYLTQHAGTLAYSVQSGICYYSSDPRHLKTFCSNVETLSEGQVLCFDSAGKVLDSDQNEITEIVAKDDYWASTKSSFGYSNYATTGYGDSANYEVGTPQAGNYTSDEDDWRAGWEDYLAGTNGGDYQDWN